MTFAEKRSKKTRGASIVRLSGSAEAPGCPASNAGLTGPRPAAKKLTSEPRSAAFAAETMDPLLFTKIPGPRPDPLRVKIPGSNAATDISTGLLCSEPDSARSIYLPGATSKGINAVICVGVTEKSGSATSPPGVAINTRVNASEVGNDSLAMALVSARFSPEIPRTVPGPNDVFAL